MTTDAAQKKLRPRYKKVTSETSTFDPRSPNTAVPNRVAAEVKRLRA